jgi:hypothetical protein
MLLTNNPSPDLIARERLACTRLMKMGIKKRIQENMRKFEKTNPSHKIVFLLKNQVYCHGIFH